MRKWMHAAIAALSLGLAFGATAQPKYPSKPITWVVGFPPGGGADGVARLVSAKMSQNMGVPFVVENRPGASSIIAAQYVAQAAPDGYTVFGAEQGALVYNAALYSKLPYDPAHDFAPISNMIVAPLVLVAHPGFAAKDLKALVEMAKKQPGKINYASPGKGLAHHLAMEVLNRRAGIDLTDVQYKGIAPATQDVIAGNVPIGVIDTVIVLPHIKSGKLRALATFSTKRLAVLPDVPSLGELGYKEMDIAPIVALVAPRKTPKEIIARLNTEVVRALKDPGVHGKLTGLGLEVIGDSPEHFGAFLDAEAKRMLPFIRSLNIKLD